MTAEPKAGMVAVALLFAALLAAPLGAEQDAAVPEAVPATATAPGPAPVRPPVHIEAEEAEYFNKENRAVFTGKVVVVQGEDTLTGERVEVTFVPKPGGAEKDGEAAPALPDAEATSIKSMVATKNVTLRQVDRETGSERYATGERAEYSAETRIVTLTGNPRAWEGKNLMTGERMDFSLESRNVVVKGKVGVTVYPGGATDAPKKP